MFYIVVILFFNGIQFKGFRLEYRQGNIAPTAVQLLPDYWLMVKVNLPSTRWTTG